MRDHGGNLDQAIAEYGQGRWIDLSTGINRQPYPLPALSTQSFTDLPTRAAMERLNAAARARYGLSGGALAALAGAQAAIQILPHILAAQIPREARILSPTYNEHAACLRQAGWAVHEVDRIEALEGASLAVVVNPNNPDGRCFPPARLLQLHQQVGALIVDESFADPRPDLSLAGQLGPEGLFVLRSFGKFYGLAGLRLGFVLGPTREIAAVSAMAGPWPVCGGALEIGARALADGLWAEATSARLTGEAARMDALASAAGWQLAGGAELFRLYETKDATQAQRQLARAHIWSRIFPYHPRWIRLGLPGSEAEWAQLAQALAGLRQES